MNNFDELNELDKPDELDELDILDVLDKNININNKSFLQANYNERVKYKVLKIWLIIVIVVTIVYCLYWYLNYDIYPVSYYNIERQNFLRSNTSAHPPPLINFLDPPDVFGNKYVKAEQIY